jgi:hypothetical protein
MASSARHDPVRELALMARAPEPGTTNLGEFCADHSAELAQWLGIDPCWLEGVRATDDEDVVQRIRQLLARARDQHVQQGLERRRDRSLAAAERLGATARWTDLGAELDMNLLLGELLADRTKKWIAFTADHGAQAVIPRHLLAAAAPLRRVHLDLAGWVDLHGLHVRWKGGRGGYNWRSHEVDARYDDLVLTVPLAPMFIVQVPQRRRGGAWLKFILSELGYV